MSLPDKPIAPFGAGVWDVAKAVHNLRLNPLLRLPRVVPLPNLQLLQIRLHILHNTFAHTCHLLAVTYRCQHRRGMQARSSV